MQKWLTNTRDALSGLFAAKPIVLVDVGASGTPPKEWRSIAEMSSFVGFDADLRELREDNAFGFRRFVMINMAVVDTERQEIELHLTASPHCSSMLKPNMANLANYGCTELFEVERTTCVAATRLDAALRSVGLSHVDWLKLDTQGKDLDIYRSLGRSEAKGVLAVDIEPGVIDFYEGENTFAPAHVYLVDDGFWLARANVQQFSRISKATRDMLASRHVKLGPLAGSPTAIEATYFRSLEHLVSIGAGLRDYACLWIFAMLDGKSGFALDIAAHIIGTGVDREVGELLLHEALAEIERGARWVSETASPIEPGSRTLRDLVPPVLRPLARTVLKTIRGGQ